MRGPGPRGEKVRAQGGVHAEGRPASGARAGREKRGDRGRWDSRDPEGPSPTVPRRRRERGGRLQEPRRAPAAPRSAGRPFVPLHAAALRAPAGFAAPP